ncbi:MAG: ABC transporter substrate-binding protein [Alphaproteobacteria bacterium]|nr:ABC transporter substrate-binding protein [Alphaproteobacteria bacterium]
MKNATPFVSAAIVAIVVFAAFGRPADATLKETAAPFVDSFGKRVIAVFTDVSVPRKEKAAQFLDLFREGFAVKALAVFTLGNYYGDTDKEFIDEYIDVFNEYISLSYSARFSLDVDPIFEVVEVVPDRDANGKEVGVRVETHLSTPGGEPALVTWRVREYRGNPIIVDVVSKGISLALTQQKEFTAVIGSNGGDVRALLDVLRRKNDELRE